MKTIGKEKATLNTLLEKNNVVFAREIGEMCKY